MILRQNCTCGNGTALDYTRAFDKMQGTGLDACLVQVQLRKHEEGPCRGVGCAE